VSPRRWIARLLGIDLLASRIEALEGRRPEGRWFIDDDPSKKRDATAQALARNPTGLVGGPPAHAWSHYYRGPKDLDWQPDLRHRHGPYL